MNVFEDILDQKETIKEPKSEPKLEIKQEEQQKTKLDLFPDPGTKDKKNVLLRYLDPRPDIKTDHVLWTLLLGNAMYLEGMEKLHGVLHWIRCGGAMVQRTDSKIGFRLLPTDWNPEETGKTWGDVKKQLLDPNKKELIQLFEITKAHGRIPSPGEVFDQKNHDSNIGKSGSEKQERLVFGQTDPAIFKKKKSR